MPRRENNRERTIVPEFTPEQIEYLVSYVEYLEVSPRVQNFFESFHCHYIWQVVELGHRLYRIKGFGREAFREIHTELQENGLPQGLHTKISLQQIEQLKSRTKVEPIRLWEFEQEFQNQK